MYLYSLESSFKSAAARPTSLIAHIKSNCLCLYFRVSFSFNKGSILLPSRDFVVARKSEDEICVWFAFFL